ncbi:MAG: hypothetical protein GXP26_06395 [Planctomycetes bacterium]|nr:hypothetical protein [Planctomycetota bacterium]
MAVLLRAIVMLVVLVGLPAAWVYYGPLPPRAQSVVDRVVDVAKSVLGSEQATAPDIRTVATPYFDPAVIPAVAIETAETPVFATEVASPTTAAPTLQEKLSPLLQQLRTLGTTEYALEKWGNDGQLYRFRCAMPLAQSEQHTQQFEAFHAQPDEAIQQVLAEVSTWQTARLSRPQFK